MAFPSAASASYPRVPKRGQGANLRSWRVSSTDAWQRAAGVESNQDYACLSYSGCTWSKESLQDRARARKAPQNGFLFYFLGIPEVLPEKRVGVIQIRKQILLRNSKGEGKPRARRQGPEGLSRERHQYRCRSVISIGPQQRVTAI